MRLSRPILRLVRILAWVTKGILLAIAIASLVLWPLSRQHEGMAERFRWTPRADRVELIRFSIGWADGRVGICIRRFEWVGESVGRGRAGVAREGVGWQWRVFRVAPWAVPEAPAPGVGPISWGKTDFADGGYSFVLRHLTFPCWLLAAVTAAWPLSSIFLAIRRIRRRAACEGHCPVCGYDLRATRVRCPECGSIVAEPKRNA